MTLFEASLFSILSFFITPLLGLLEPYVQQVTQTLTSSALHRKIVKFMIGLFVLILLVGVSVAAYLSFYWLYIPQRGHVGQVHLQYEKPRLPGVMTAGPSAEIDFSRGGRYGQFLRADQAYDISVNLAVPTSEQNVAIGNFMVVVTLLRADGKIIMSSSRPAILTYQSQPLRLMRTAWKAVPLVLDWSKEDQVLKVPMIENYIEDSANPVTRAYVEISHPDLQVYRSTIHIDAHFHGLRYFMYYWKVSTALVFMAVFIFWEIIFSVVTWQVLAGWFGSDSEALAIAHGIRPQPDSRSRQQQQALRAPTSYQGTGAASNTSSRGQIQSVALPPRQPQLQDDQRRLRSTDSDSDGEFEEEEEEQPRRYTSGQRPKDFGHDEEEDDEDLELEHLDQRFTDDAVVPETTPLASGAATSASTPSNVTQHQRRQESSRVTGPYVEDGSSSACGSTTSSRRTVRSGVASNMNMSMSSSTSSGLPPPPPPPSVLSERSTDFQMSTPRRRTAVESEYTEEEEEDEYQDDGNNTEIGVGEIGFEEEDFAEAALRSPGGTSSVRSRVGGRSTSSGATREGRWESKTTATTTTTTARTTARSGGH
ncbi:Berardinelli-Seip congenital lipodystrophy 2 (seipin) [Podila minutissima]|uniref:Berardinelli-Seip congenital lipodystrophy 2 (Seipin) n=1 Tax=Podila minutissima TaxID=64525 RepID=A0A9P5SGB2_9FUNG|nr:Berardinelli-Seip congenital lipodystrophy 2 (seipin) [Podila minutissima]